MLRTARSLLRPFFAGALSAEAVVLLSRLLCRVLEIGALLCFHQPLASTASARPLPLLLTGGAFLFDFLLTSPFLCGKALFYRCLATDSLAETPEKEALLNKIEPGIRHSPLCLFHFFQRKYYGRCLCWRLWHMIGISLPLGTASVLSVYLLRLVQHKTEDAFWLPEESTALLLAATGAGILLLAGGLLSLYVALRLSPAIFALDQARFSLRTVLRHRSASAAWAETLFSCRWWLFSCLFILPLLYVIPLLQIERARILSPDSGVAEEKISLHIGGNHGKLFT